MTERKRRNRRKGGRSEMREEEKENRNKQRGEGLRTRGSLACKMDVESDGGRAVMNTVMNLQVTEHDAIFCSV
jgi:hypothetical protein